VTIDNHDTSAPITTAQSMPIGSQRLLVNVQPVMPKWRATLFDALAESARYQLIVPVSIAVPGSQNSAAIDTPWMDQEHACVGGPGLIFWQRSLSLMVGS
jgi:hypothetical protein